MRQYFQRGFGWTLSFLHPTPNHSEISEVFKDNVPEYWSVSKEVHARFCSSMSIFLKRLKKTVIRISGKTNWLFKSLHSHYSIGMQQQAELDRIVFASALRISPVFQLYCSREGILENTRCPLYDLNPQPYGCWSTIHMNFNSMHRTSQYFLGGIQSFSLIEPVIWKGRYTNRNVIASDLLYLLLNDAIRNSIFYKNLRDVALSPKYPRQVIYLGWSPFRKNPIILSFYHGCNLRFDFIRASFTPDTRRYGGYEYFIERFNNRVKIYRESMEYERRLIE